MSGIKVVTAWTTSAVPTSTQKSFMRVNFIKLLCRHY
jgi:hypothetical protein